MKPLAINGRFLTQPLSGVQRYARELLNAFDRRLVADAALAERFGPVTAYYPASLPVIDWPDWSAIRVVPLSGGTGHAWEQGTLAWASRAQRLISLCGAGPLAHRDQLLVIHDANIFDLPEAFSAPYRIFHRAMRQRLARRVARLATVSDAAATALARHLRVQTARFAVIPNSADHILSVTPDPGTLTRYGLEPGGYLLTVGNQSLNKNIARLVAAHASIADMPVLAVVGGYAPGLAAQRMKATARLRLPGRVTDPELRSLYAGALGFVWPSRCEGFGIPPLEAMALGVPVMSSNTTAMPEVLGDAAVYFDPDSTADIAAKLAEFPRMTPVERGLMIAKGKARARIFCWDTSVDRLIAVLDGIGAAPQL